MSDIIYAEALSVEHNIVTVSGAPGPHGRPVSIAIEKMETDEPIFATASLTLDQARILAKGLYRAISVHGKRR